MAQHSTASITLVRQRARQLKHARAVAFARLFPNPGAGATNPALNRLADTFSRYASTQTTAYDSGTASSGAAAGVGLLERQVERAMAQVLGGAPGRSPDSFMTALKSAFPSNGNGTVSTLPARSAVSLYVPDGNGSSPQASGLIAAGLAGQISAEQANLYREASIVVNDAVQVLRGLQPFAPEAEADRVEALRSLVEAEFMGLSDEFKRIDEPRPQRVDAYFGALLGPNGHLLQLGREAYLVTNTANAITAATSSDEVQIAGFRLLQSYGDRLKHIWDLYNTPRNVAYPLFTERLSRASVLLPVIAEGNANFMNAMDSIGFTETERRSAATKFTTMARSLNPVPALPDMTVNDLNEWIDHFANTEGPGRLTDAGQFGLEFVADQADKLFWVFVPILTFTKALGTPGLSRASLVAQVLTHERVSWALDDLINQIKALADEAA